MPIQQDIAIWRGNNAPPITWAWPDGYAGSTNLQLTVWIAGTLILTAGLGDTIVSDPVARQFAWYPTVAQSRTIPLGRIANYELEDRVGGEVTRWYGAVIGQGGDNLDVGGGNYGATLDIGDPANTFLFPAMW